MVPLGRWTYNLRQVAHTGGLSTSSIIWCRSSGGDALRLGRYNLRSGVALAMRQWFIHLRTHSLRKGDEHPAYGMTKYRKGPQRTHKRPQRTTKDPQKTHKGPTKDRKGALHRTTEDRQS